MDPLSVITAISAVVRKHKSNSVMEDKSGQSIVVVLTEVELSDKTFSSLCRCLPRNPTVFREIRSASLLVVLFVVFVVLKSTCGASTSKIAIMSNSMSISVMPISVPFGTRRKNVMRSNTWPGGSVGAAVGAAVGNADGAIDGFKVGVIEG